MYVKLEKYLISLCVIAIVVSTGIIGVDFVGASPAGNSNSDSGFKQQSQLPFSEREQMIQPTDSITVIGDHPGDRLIAFAPDGRLLYYNDTFDRYHDVDPSTTGNTTVELVGVEYLSEEKTRNFVQRINLTTGETEILYSHIVPRIDGTHRWHDVDRIGPHRLVIADIYRDSVFIVNTTTEERTYEWHAQNAYPLSGGGPWPSDWTHLNDVEVLDDGRIMVSLRNQDQVIFLEPGKGLLENWTLGAEDEYDILYEQHNPDYIPEERGGPAILVADSQNDRVVEYQRENGSWVQTWQWSDTEMQWPRDADRLPNGNTLIADSNSDRILEINESGDVVWQITGVSNYEVERLGTGDESSGGHSAEELDLRSRTVQESTQSQASEYNSVLTSLKRSLDFSSILPAKVTNAILFIAPNWMSFWSILALSANMVAGVFFISLMFRRSSYNFQSPLVRSNEEN